MKKHRDHDPECPRAMAWDHGEFEAVCLECYSAPPKEGDVYCASCLASLGLGS